MVGNIIQGYKLGMQIDIALRTTRTFKKPKGGTPLPKNDVFAIDVEARNYKGKLTTVLVQVHLFDHTEVIETKDVEYPITAALDVLFPAYAEHEGKESYTKQREKRARKDGTTRRDGRRKTIHPKMCIFYNMSYDLPRLFGNHPQFMRQVVSSANSVRIQVGEYEVEIVSLFLTGGAPNFEMYIRRDGRIMRIYGRDLFGYWKNGLDATSKSLLGEGKVDLDGDEEDDEGISHLLSQEEFELLSQKDQDKFKEYSAKDAQLTRDCYLATVDVLMKIDKVVVMPDGTIPVSAPSAAARIALGMGDDEWERPAQWVMQMGADAYAGARVFNRRPGYQGVVCVLDLNSAYPHAITLLPDPCSTVYRAIPEQEFNVDDWKGKWGVIYISGEGTDPYYPALRLHDLEHKRLRYVYGKFTNLAVSIPEAVIGVVSGRLRVDHIHTGCWMDGSRETSFMRKFVLTVHEKKELEKSKGRKEEALAQGCKLLINAFYGKMAEVQLASSWVDEMALTEEVLCIPDIEKEPAQSALLRAYSEGSLESEGHSGSEGLKKLFDTWKAQYPDITEVKHLDEVLDGNKPAKAGNFYLPMHAAQITGFVSAQLGLGAFSMNAIQGDTDSLMPAMTAEEAVRHLKLYQWYMTESGYDCPMTGLGAFEVEIDEAVGYFVKSKNYALHYVKELDEKTYLKYLIMNAKKKKKGERETVLYQKDGVWCAELYKAAKHGMPGVDAYQAFNLYRHFLAEGPQEFTTKKRPVTARVAYKRTLATGKIHIPGVFEDHRVIMSAPDDPNQEKTDAGERVWKKMTD